jgi:hypothetical protein
VKNSQLVAGVHSSTPLAGLLATWIRILPSMSVVHTILGLPQLCVAEAMYLIPLGFGECW